MPKFWKSVGLFGRQAHTRGAFRGVLPFDDVTGGNSPPRYQVTLRGWQLGLKKISLTDALVEFADLSVPQAKRLVDQLLTGTTVRVTISGLYPPEHVVSALQAIGAIVELEAAPQPHY